MQKSVKDLKKYFADAKTDGIEALRRKKVDMDDSLFNHFENARADRLTREMRSKIVCHKAKKDGQKKEKEIDCYFVVRRMIHDFTQVNDGRKPKYLIVDEAKLYKIYTTEEYVHEYMLAKRGSGDHYCGLLVCTVNHRTDRIFEVA